jgi:hypothetical protein
MTSVNARVARLERRQHQLKMRDSPAKLWDEAMDACDRGVATMEEYQRVLGEEVALRRAQLLPAVPALVACQRIGAPILSPLVACTYVPGDPIPEDLRLKLEEEGRWAQSSPPWSGRVPGQDTERFRGWVQGRGQSAFKFLVHGGEEAHEWRVALWEQAIDGTWRLRPEVLEASRTTQADMDLEPSYAYPLYGQRGGDLPCWPKIALYSTIVEEAVRISTNDGVSPGWSVQVSTGHTPTDQAGV